jgi:hypothetical protein
MSIPKQQFAQYIKDFNFRELFNEMGWNRDRTNHVVAVNGGTYTLTSVAEKSGFRIFICNPGGNGGLPDSKVRRKIETQITKLFQEHLIIYTDGENQEQIWQSVIREIGKPLKPTETRYHINQDPELLYQKTSGLFFEMDEEEKITIVDVKKRVTENFHANAEKVTKKFYEKFKKEHTAFLGFIKGIDDRVNKDWYASLMLNRLMFIYFIQKKGFLDSDRDYLRNRLKIVQRKKGKNKFYSFYRNFLLVLFHKGLGSPLRDSELEEEIGRVPYLNGGLFDVHKIEEEYADISIEDKAFQKLFDFFDEYNWHLDTGITATGKDINPDVIGYIFEKYINDRAAMGAYYTKEDITEYISKNCIIPWLFDEVMRQYGKAIGKKGWIWSYLMNSGDTYIYPAVKYGINSELSEKDGFSDLPEDVQEGLDPNTPDLIEKRKCWNRPAPSDIALPTEIYREVIDRRKRYYEVQRKIEQGEITEINDFITYNLDIRQFLQDVLKETDDAEFIKQFYKAVRKITVLDPTCGSGAFLFAALNVLEPIYSICVSRMREFVEVDGEGKHKYFEEELHLIDSDEHPSEQYFIYKEIILHNLYGVDIMQEAVEIAKLRLFLKLVATVDVDYSQDNLGLEPLPDIDFNIRAGNTLVGYATLADLDKSEKAGLFGKEEKRAIIEEADIVSKSYARFKDAQIMMYTNPKEYKNAKNALSERLALLNDKLNKYLAVSYLGPDYKLNSYTEWLNAHNPFHWFSEFYLNMISGFSVVIGNPPYVEYTDKKLPYRIDKSLYYTYSSRNLYSFVFERAKMITYNDSRVGMIVQISSISTPTMESMVAEIKRNVSNNWISNYATRPSYLFDGVTMNLTIILSELLRSNYQNEPIIHVSHYLRWNPEYRKYLFENIPLIKVKSDNYLFKHSIPKLKSNIDNELLLKLCSQKYILSYYLEPTKKRTNNRLYYRTVGGRYYKIFLDRDFGSESKSNKVKY